MKITTGRKDESIYLEYGNRHGYSLDGIEPAARVVLTVCDGRGREEPKRLILPANVAAALGAALTDMAGRLEAGAP